MSYHVAGLISAVIFLLTLGGLWSQLQLVWKRRRDFEQRLSTQRPTAILSLNQFISSFLAFFSFFLYGMCLEPFNHYLVWPRLAASLLTLALLYEIMRDRKEWLPVCAFIAGVMPLVGGPVWLVLNPQIMGLGRRISQGLIVAVTVVLAQGYSHQILLIRQSGQTGAVALRLHQFFFLKDASTIAFAATMGLRSGWPLILLASVSAATKLATMWHFRWTRCSPLAQQRRAALLSLKVEQPGSDSVSVFPPPSA